MSPLTLHAVSPGLIESASSRAATHENNAVRYLTRCIVSPLIPMIHTDLVACVSGQW
jgi:hypothetical protein